MPESKDKVASRNDRLSVLFSIFSLNRRAPTILQTEAAECGLASLAMVAAYHGLEYDLTNLRLRFPISMRGASLRSLMQMSAELGFTTRAVRLELEEAHQLKLPAILHWEMNHFVVLTKVERSGRVHINDPARGARVLSPQEFSNAFTGVALELSPGAKFKKADETNPLRMRQLWSRLDGLPVALMQAIGLSIVLQAFVIVSPFYMQIVIDDVLPRLDIDLLIVLAVGFGLFALINVIASTLRNLLFLSLGSTMGYQLSANLAQHLLRLPIAYFERRHAGDILSRFGSLAPIQAALTSSLVAAIIDGVMAAITLALMLWYSGWLSAITITALSLVLIIRVALFRVVMDQNQEVIVAQAKQSSLVIETLRGMSALRLAGAEGARGAIWQNRMAETVNAQLTLGRTNIGIQTINGVLLGLENIIVVYAAARLAIDGGFSVGMIFAFMAYKAQFSDKAVALVDRWIEYRMLDLHLRRLADIALTGQDPSFGQPSSAFAQTPFQGGLTLKGVKYRYSPADPWVLNGAELEVTPGSHVVIVGPSGGGKSTLIKVLLGLLPPEEGQVLADGQPLDRFGYAAYRAQVAAVMQDDVLFAGSIAANIAVFDPAPEMERIVACAQAACIHDDIAAMPMRYETLVGDMGGALSGGQRQRVMIARALYRQPKLLVMDEGTAHLDLANEAQVARNLAVLGLTRVTVTHRVPALETNMAIYVLAGGMLAQQHIQTPVAAQ